MVEEVPLVCTTTASLNCSTGEDGSLENENNCLNISKNEDKGLSLLSL